MSREHGNTDEIRLFRRQLYHTCIAEILKSLHSAMTKPEAVRCPDGHYRRAVYGIGADIGDYPEQALHACIVEGWCPMYARSNITS